MSNNRLIIFAKAPIAGLAKTRLGDDIGMQAAAEFYESLLRQQLERIRALEDCCQLMLYSAGTVHQKWFQQHLPEWPCKLQHGRSLGQRMAHAFQEQFDGAAAKVLLIGSDIPDLTGAVLRAAYELLDNTKVVLGPAYDGGYYLIGQQSPGWPLFSDIAWSTDQVLTRTMARADQLGLSLRLLPALRDIDSLDDLEAYQSSDNQ